MVTQQVRTEHTNVTFRVPKGFATHLMKVIVMVVVAVVIMMERVGMVMVVVLMVKDDDGSDNG